MINSCDGKKWRLVLPNSNELRECILENNSPISLPGIMLQNLLVGGLPVVDRWHSLLTHKCYITCQHLKLPTNFTLPATYQPRISKTNKPKQETSILSDFSEFLTTFLPIAFRNWKQTPEDEGHSLLSDAYVGKQKGI